MICKICLRSVIVQAGHIGAFTQRAVQLVNTRRIANEGLGLKHWFNRQFKTSLRMMVDNTGATGKQGPITDALSEKNDEGIGYSSGRCKRFKLFRLFVAHAVRKYFFGIEIDFFFLSVS